MYEGVEHEVLLREKAVLCVITVVITGADATANEKRHHITSGHRQ